MAERVRYRTKQQELIRDCLEKHSDRFVTAEQCMDCLKAEGIHVGQTTVYRALDRLTEENAVIKIPAVDGAGAPDAPAGYEHRSGAARHEFLGRNQ